MKPRSNRAIAWTAAAALSIAYAGSPKPETVKAWDDYILTAGQTNDNHTASFLQMQDTAPIAERIKKGQIVVMPAPGHVPRKVPSGLIHDWMGASFLPDANLQDVIVVLRDYGKYKEFFAPRVLESKVASSNGMEDHFSILLMNKSVISKTALDCEYQTRFVQVDEHRMYSITEAKQIQEIAEYGTPKQHTLPPAAVTGLIWKLYNVNRFEERDGGVYMETQAIALSRDIPSGLRFVVEPIVRRVSRDALDAALRQTATAVAARKAAVAAVVKTP
jgi:hypothetical protein